MLTPGFELSQNDEFLIVSILIPYAKISDVEVHFEDTDFMFYSKPYYLRLNLPGKVQYSEKPNVDYNVDKKVLTIKAPKAVKGEIFDGLDLVTKLLTTKKNKAAASPMIEVIDGLNSIEADQEEDEEFDWSIEQNPCEEFSNISLTGEQCGFANSYSYAVFKLKEETQEIFDVREPQNKSPLLRREERLKTESRNFDEDHYIADLYHDDEIQQLLKYKPEWEELYEKLQSNSPNSCDDMIQFTSEEKEKLRKLPNKEYILDKNQVKLAFLSLVDIIFAYAYNKRTTEGENTVESAWTVNKLSPTLSWLESFSSVAEVALASIRRSLCYPLFRHFELSVTILEDVRKIFLLGRKYVIKCLLEIHEMFSFSEPRYILNELFITDYCVWMQTEKCASSKLVPLANALEKVLLTKGDIGFNLVDVESFAAVAWMAHNPSAKGFPHSINKDKHILENGEKSHSGETNADALCINMEKLSFQGKPNVSSTSAVDSSLNDFSEYESCSSCTSDSSCSSSNTFETDSDESDSDDAASSSDSEDDDSTSDSDDDAHRHLLKKVNNEKYR